MADIRLDGQVTVTVEQPEAPLIVTGLPTLPSGLAVVPVPGPPGTAVLQADRDRIVAQAAEAVTVLLDQHVTDPTPHPAYDDMQSLRLIFENGLV